MKDDANQSTRIGEDIREGDIVKNKSTARTTIIDSRSEVVSVERIGAKNRKERP